MLCCKVFVLLDVLFGSKVDYYDYVGYGYSYDDFVDWGKCWF